MTRLSATNRRIAQPVKSVRSSWKRDKERLHKEQSSSAGSCWETPRLAAISRPQLDIKRHLQGDAYGPHIADDQEMVTLRERIAAPPYCCKRSYSHGLAELDLAGGF